MRFILLGLHLSCAAAAFLAFAWPFAVSADRDSAAFRVAALAVLLTFLAALTILCIGRLRAGAPDA